MEKVSIKKLMKKRKRKKKKSKKETKRKDKRMEKRKSTVLLDIGLRFRTANITQTVPIVSSNVP